MYLLYANNPFEPISYTTHRTDTTGIFAASNLDKLATTHLLRSEVKARQSHAGVGEIESDRHMGFRHQTSTDVYGRASHCIAATLPTAGWLTQPLLTSFKCSWESDGSNIPNGVKDTVLSGLDNLLDYATNVQKRVASQRISRGSATGDESAIAFLKVLVYLRKVFIEDSIYFQPKYSELPCYSGHQIFMNYSIQLIWKQYALEEERCIKMRAISFMENNGLPTPILLEINQVMQAAGMAASAAAKAAEVAQAAAERATLQNLKPKAIKYKQFPQNVETVRNSLIEYPLPPLEETIYNIKVFYDRWKTELKAQYLVHMQQNGGKCAWKMLYGDKHGAISKRYTSAASFLQFLDGLSSTEACRAIAIMEQFAAEHSIKHTNLVRVVFYHMVRPLTKCNPSDKVHVDRLYKSLTQASPPFRIMLVSTKQDHSKKTLQ